jgi:hypothetical protein
MDNKKTSWEDIKFPIVKNIQPISLADSIEGISTKDMPRRMEEMYQSIFKHAVDTINKELNEIRGTEGKEERVKYLEELLKSWDKK